MQCVINTQKSCFMGFARSDLRMEAGMLKKLFYLGLGLSEFIYENFEKLAKTGEVRLAEIKEAKSEQDVAIPVQTESEEFVEPGSSVTVSSKADDLTTINGIGPTFAQRLKDAGVTTYSQLASMSPEQLKEITHAADWQADPNDWILQAKAVA